MSVEAQNLTAAPLELFDLGLTIPASARRSLNSGGRLDADVYASHSVRAAIIADALRIRINGHVLTKSDALDFVSVETVAARDRDRAELRRLTLRAPNGTLWDIGIDNSGNLRTRTR